MPFAYVAVYGLLLTAAWWLVLKKITKATPPMRAALDGAVFGAACYGTYNFTNMITLPGYRVWISLVDTAWGAFAIALLASVYRAFI
jgi:uncharacterized membrane protein